ncbi:DUF4097 family beta strand repeat-containing protein [Streptomyces sp. NPDC059786]|uniref:DUF4097 family beta strand repeat-containing protein n=1 Tax=Streptomyces sp. NPDC059786 TaxID=3346946 RepID=UPI0036585349
MERVFTATTPGPVTLDLPAGSARVTVDQTAKTATIRLHTTDNEGPSVDAIRRATAGTLRGLTVTVPETAGGNGGVTVVTRGSNYSSVSIGGGTVIVNGQVISGGNISSGITADIVVPASTALTFRSKSADLHASGPLASLNATTMSGDIEAGVIGSVAAKTMSGDIDIDAVVSQVTASAMSGDIEIGSYSGSSAMLNSMSGDLALSATSASSGLLSAQTVSGDIRLRGTRHLNPQASTVSGRVRT